MYHQKNRDNLNKKIILQNINKKIGMPVTFLSSFYKELIKILNNALKTDNYLNIKNFGTFKILYKKERIGRNPKTKKIHIISARNVISFKSSAQLKKKLNNAK